MISFDPDTHTYTVDGKTVPGVTTVLKAAGLVETRHHTEGSANRGSEIHEATSLIDQGVMSIDDWKDDDIHPYLFAWEKFKKESGAEVVEIEQLLYHETLRYATMVDRVLKGSAGRFIVDIKTGPPQSWHGIQLASNTALTGLKERVIVELKRKGDYRIHFGWKDTKYTERIWDQLWLSAVTLYHWREQAA